MAKSTRTKQRKPAKKPAKKSTRKPAHPVMGAGRSVKIPIHSMMDILGAIEELRQTKQFRTAAKRQKAFVTVHSDTVNFVKGYLHKNDLHTKHAVARKVVGACPPPDRYRCPYEQKD